MFAEIFKVGNDYEILICDNTGIFKDRILNHRK